jgi:predicted nucleic acid-binding protein
MKVIDTDVVIDHFHGHEPAMAYLATALAATAAQAGADLVTRNIKHYPMTDVRVTPPYERGRR